jgi:hypothetical protein
VTLKPLDWSNLASEAAIMPFPSEEVTPPVMKIYLVLKTIRRRGGKFDVILMGFKIRENYSVMPLLNEI